MAKVTQSSNMSNLSSMGLLEERESQFSEITHLKEPLKIEDLRVAEIHMAPRMRHKLAWIQKTFKSIKDSKFLDLFEKRFVIFMEDGFDLNGFKP